MERCGIRGVRDVRRQLVADAKDADLGSASPPNASRASPLGHIQRGGSPTAFDRILGTRFGTAAVDAVADGQFGHMVALRTPDIVLVALEEAIANDRAVDPAGQLTQAARDVGICLGE